MNEIGENKRSWDVLLIGGASGTGKTCASYPLARHFGVGIAEVDDLYIVLECLTTPEQQPTLHYWRTNPEAAQRLSPEKILEHHISVSRVLAPAVKAVIDNHLETQTPIVLEGDYLLPEILLLPEIITQQQERVRAVFLYEPDEMQILQNFHSREPDEGKQAGRARVSWLHGQWLKDECERLGLAALPSRPWDTLPDRIREATS